MNIDYGTLNGEEGVFGFILYGKVNLKDIKHILLMTDGVKVLEENHDDHENMDILANLFLEKGLKALLTYVRNKENNDRDCKKYPRTKVHDDATAIAISL